jgi:hypothetical protein
MGNNMMMMMMMMTSQAAAVQLLAANQQPCQQPCACFTGVPQLTFVFTMHNTF